MKITEKSTLEDLYKKYSTLPQDVVQDIYNYNAKNVVSADFELKEMMFEPEKVPDLWEDFKPELVEEQAVNLEKEQNKSASKESTAQQIEQDNTPSQPVVNQEQEDELIHDFTEHHKTELITKDELKGIVDVVREGQKGVNYSEEKYMQAQFSNDLMLVQMFIVEKLEQQKNEKLTANGINVKSKTEFPSLVNL